MKVTSKHFKPGTRVIAKDGSSEAGKTGTIMAIRTSPELCVVKFDNPGSHEWLTNTFANEYAPLYHGPGWIMKAKELKRIKPEKPAPSTVPEGCPVDEQCHREMTAAGWYWARHGGAYTTDFADMRPDGQIYICLNIDADRRGIINKASDTLAAWRERANR